MCCRYEQPRGLQGSEAARRESWAAPFSFHLSPSLTPDGGADTDAALSALQSGGATPGNEGTTPEAGVLRPPDGFTSGMWADREPAGFRPGPRGQHDGPGSPARLCHLRCLWKAVAVTRKAIPRGHSQGWGAGSEAAPGARDGELLPGGPELPRPAVRETSQRSGRRQGGHRPVWPRSSRSGSACTHGRPPGPARSALRRRGRCGQESGRPRGLSRTAGRAGMRPGHGAGAAWVWRRLLRVSAVALPGPCRPDGSLSLPGAGARGTHPGLDEAVPAHPTAVPRPLWVLLRAPWEWPPCPASHILEMCTETYLLVKI